MKGFIRDKAIIITDPLPDNLQDGDEVEISIIQVNKKTYPFSVLEPGIRDQYLNRILSVEAVLQGPFELEQYAARTTGKAVTDRIQEIGQACARLPVLDDRSPDEIIGYNDIGVPE